MARDDFDDRDHDEPEPQPVLPARFADNATGVDDELTVTIAGVDGSRGLYGPVAWAPRHGPVYPQAGDRAWVTEVLDPDDGSQEWIVLLWQPA